MSDLDESEEESAEGDEDVPYPHTAAIALCADSVVRAYRTVAEARAAHPGLAPAVYAITEFGARAAQGSDDHHYSLLHTELPAVKTTTPALTASLDESLLRTNVQKSVRRQLPVAARDSVLQYFAQVPSKGQNDYQKKLLERLAVMAAEDASTVPLLPTVIFHLVGATAIGPNQAHASATIVAECAAQLAMAHRDPDCTNAHAWQPDDGEQLQLVKLRFKENIFAKGWDAADVAQVLLVHVAAKIVGRRCRAWEMEGRWLFALERAMRGRLAAGRPACAASLWTPSTSGVWPPLQPDGTLLALADRLYFSADWHNPARWKELQGRLKQSLSKLVKLKDAMKQQSLLNVRDAQHTTFRAAVVHVLTVPQKPDTTPWPKELYERAWPEAASALWAARPLPPAEPTNKRAGAPGSSTSSDSAGGKQAKLAWH